MQWSPSPVPGSEGDRSEFLGHGRPEECRFLLNTQLMFLKTEKEPTTKMFDDDEWIRPLMEVEAITADIPDVQVTFAAQGDTSRDKDVDSKKMRRIQMG